MNKKVFLLLLVGVFLSINMFGQCINSSDCDGDGIDNATDLDNDNDGILDANEGVCSGFKFDAGWFSNSPGGTLNQDGYWPNAPSGPIYYANANEPGRNSATIASAQPLVVGPGVNLSPVSTRFNITNAGEATYNGAKTNGDYLQFTFTTTAAQNYSTFAYLGFGDSKLGPTYKVAVELSNNGFATPGTMLIQDFQPVYQTSGGSYSYTVANVPAGNLILLQPSTTYTFRVYMYAVSSTAALIFDDFQFGTCKGQDTDNDGIPDFQDTDSDGDGCPDALEGAANFTTANIDANGRLTGGVSATGIALIAGSSGQGIGTSITATVNACNPNAYLVTNSYAGAPRLVNLGNAPLQGADSTSGINRQSWAARSIVITAQPTNGFILKYNGVAVTLNQPIANYDPALLTIEPGPTSAGGTQSTTFQYAVLDANNAQSPASPYTINFSLGLPVSFGSIEAFIINDELTVNWTSLQETNNDYFEIQLSDDGENFTTIGTVKTKAPGGNSSSEISYTFSKNFSGLLAGISFLILMILVPAFKKWSRLLLPVLVIAYFVSCNKTDKNLVKSDEKLYVRIIQTDIDGTKKYSTIVTVLKK